MSPKHPFDSFPYLSGPSPGSYLCFCYDTKQQLPLCCQHSRPVPARQKLSGLHGHLGECVSLSCAACFLTLCSSSLPASTMLTAASVDCLETDSWGIFVAAEKAQVYGRHIPLRLRSHPIVLITQLHLCAVNTSINRSTRQQRSHQLMFNSSTVTDTRLKNRKQTNCPAVMSHKTSDSDLKSWIYRGCENRSAPHPLPDFSVCCIFAPLTCFRSNKF